MCGRRGRSALFVRSLPLLIALLSTSHAAFAAPCAVRAGQDFDIDGSGRFVLRGLTFLQPAGCIWYAPRGIVLNGYQLSNAGLAPIVIRTDPGATAIVVTNERSGNYLIDNLRIEAQGGRGIEFQLSDPDGAAGSQISRVTFAGTAAGIWGLASGVRVTESDFDGPIGILAPGNTGPLFHPTIDGNVFRNAIWAVFVVSNWQRSERWDGWASPETLTELAVRDNTIECAGSNPWSAGVILQRVNKAGIEENTIRGCTYGVLMDTSHRVLISENTIDDLGASRRLRHTTRGVLDLYSAGWAVYHNDIHAMWGVQSVQKGGRFLMQDAVWWNRIWAQQGYRVHVESLVAYPANDASSFPDKEWGGNNHYRYLGDATAEAGDQFEPLVVTGGAQSPYPGFPYPYEHDPSDPNLSCDSRWTWVNPGTVDRGRDDVKGNFAEGYVQTRDDDADGINDVPVSFPGQATLACTIKRNTTFRFKEGPFWWDRCFRVQEFTGAGRGRASPGAGVAPCF